MPRAALIEVLDTPALLAHPRAQTGEVTYAEKITKETLHLSPSRSAEETLRTVRLGGAFCFVEGLRVMVLGASLVCRVEKTRCDRRVPRPWRRQRGGGDATARARASNGPDDART